MHAMQELHSEVQRLQALGLEFRDVKQQIAAVVASQRANREALAAIKGSAAAGGAAHSDGMDSELQQWVPLPSSVWLQLPTEQAERVLRSDAQEQGARLEALFGRQKKVLAQLEDEGLGPEHFNIRSSSGSSSGGGSSGGGS